MSGRTGSGVINILALCFFLTVGSKAAFAADGVTFGDKPTHQSEVKFDYQLSEDKQAFTIAFEGFEVTTGSGKVPARVSERTRGTAGPSPIGMSIFSIVIPVMGNKPLKTSFFASGFALTTKGAYGTLLFNVNGKNTIATFGPNSDREFVQKLEYRGGPTSEIRIAIFLLVERNSPDAAAFLNVSAIDTDLALAKKRSAKKK